MRPCSACSGIPFKSGAHAAPVEYLETAEIEALLAGIDRLDPVGTARLRACSR